MRTAPNKERCLRVLLVDDEPVIRALLKTTLESLDVELDEAQDAGSAVFAISARRPDAIVLDVNLLGIERAQRRLLQNAYRETVAALASALETKDTGTRAHSQRVQRYALELARQIEPDLAEDAGTEYGFLLHDVGKIGIPDRILLM